MSKFDEMKLDAAELYRLAELTERRSVKDLLTIEARKIETAISLNQEAVKNVVATPNAPIATTASVKRYYDVKLTSYGWDQTNSVVKIFIQLPHVETLPAENITCNFTEFAFDLYVKELEGKNYTLSVKNLSNAIDTEKCSWKVKSGMVILSLPKKTSSHWDSLTKKESEKKKLSKPKMDEQDPTAGIMDLMKQMYEEGDDEMKRTIAKAWTESREKNMNMGF